MNFFVLMLLTLTDDKPECVFYIYSPCLFVSLVSSCFETVFVDCETLIFKTMPLLTVAFVNSCLFTRYAYITQ